MHVRTRAPERAVLQEVRRVHHERVAFPTAHRVAGQKPDRFRRVRTAGEIDDRALWIISLTIVTWSRVCTSCTLLLYALGTIGGPELNPRMQRSGSGRSSGLS